MTFFGYAVLHQVHRKLESRNVFVVTGRMEKVTPSRSAAREELTRSLMASPLGTTSVLLAGSGPQDAADAWRAYTEGKGAIVDVDAPDFKAMMEKLYGNITPLIEEPPEAHLTATGDAEAWAAAVSRTMRQPGQRQVFGGPGKKP
jgi:hypothetical protein